MPGEKWMALLGALPGGGAAGRRGSSWVAGGWGRGPSRRQGAEGSGVPRSPVHPTRREFRFRFGPGRRRRGRPERLQLDTRGVNPKAPQAQLGRIPRVTKKLM